MPYGALAALILQDMLRLQGQSAFLFGRDRLVVDVPLDHGSCSKQHAVVQFREVSSTNEWGDRVRSVKYAPTLQRQRLTADPILSTSTLQTAPRSMARPSRRRATWSCCPRIWCSLDHLRGNT